MAHFILKKIQVKVLNQKNDEILLYNSMTESCDGKLAQLQCTDIQIVFLLCIIKVMSDDNTVCGKRDNTEL